MYGSIGPAARGDAGDISHLSYLAARGHVRMSVLDLLVPGPPGPTKERLTAVARLCVARQKSIMHHCFYTVARVKGRVASSLCTYARESVEKGDFAAALCETGWSAEEIESMARRMEPFFRVNPSVPAKTWVIENVATYSDYRRRGLIESLLVDAIQRGQSAGYGRFQVSCFIGNLPARRAYEKVGFRVADRYADDEFESIFECPGMYRLVLETRGPPDHRSGQSLTR